MQAKLVSNQSTLSFLKVLSVEIKGKNHYTQKDIVLTLQNTCNSTEKLRRKISNTSESHTTLFSPIHGVLSAITTTHHAGIFIEIHYHLQFIVFIKINSISHILCVLKCIMMSTILSLCRVIFSIKILLVIFSKVPKILYCLRASSFPNSLMFGGIMQYVVFQF